MSVGICISSWALQSRRDISSAKFEDAEYSPNAICEVEAGRLCKLTNLSKGQVLALKKFFCQWCGKVDVKRAKVA